MSCHDYFHHVVYIVSCIVLLSCCTLCWAHVLYLSYIGMFCTLATLECCVLVYKHLYYCSIQSLLWSWFHWSYYTVSSQITRSQTEHVHRPHPNFWQQSLAIWGVGSHGEKQWQKPITIMVLQLYYTRQVVQPSVHELTTIAHLKVVCQTGTAYWDGIDSLMAIRMCVHTDVYILGVCMVIKVSPIHTSNHTTPPILTTINSSQL